MVIPLQYPELQGLDNIYGVRMTDVTPKHKCEHTINITKGNFMLH